MTSQATCRACGGGGLTLVLSLGLSPLANALLTKEELARPEEKFPLDLAFCSRCSLVQITETVPPEKMFREYLYFSSFSDTMVEHARAIADRLADERKLGRDNLALEIASNDGYLLQHYAKRGVPVLGIEPARNIAKVAVEERGIRTIAEFFGKELAATLAERGERADVIHANNVLAHVPDLNGVVEGLAIALKDDGVAVIEAPYAKDLVDHCEFDTIYHEHLCYFSLTALDNLVDRHDLVVRDVERLAIHGGSLRIFVSKKSAASRGRAVEELLAEEAAGGVATLAPYLELAKRVEALKAELVRVLRGLKADGKRIAAYGAAAKGSTLLNSFGIGKDVLDFVADRSTYKQGRYMPGIHVPIVDPRELVARKPDACLLLTWNFADEILAQQREYRENGGKFIIPIPEVRTL
ncbi:MAG: class I SAM-dependent methyltransferase [Labilithrix sp.]|nr:class I SAM-dependent methyltransferase [Labilithrix sp.]